MKAAEDQQLPKEHLLPALSSGGCADPTQEGQQEAGKKEEPFGRDGWNVLAGRFCGSWPAAIHLGTKAKGRGSWGVRARDGSGIPGFATRAVGGCMCAPGCTVGGARTYKGVHLWRSWKTGVAETTEIMEEKQEPWFTQTKGFPIKPLVGGLCIRVSGMSGRVFLIEKMKKENQRRKRKRLWGNPKAKVSILRRLKWL